MSESARLRLIIDNLSQECKQVAGWLGRAEESYMTRQDELNGDVNNDYDLFAYRATMYFAQDRIDEIHTLMAQMNTRLGALDTTVGVS